MFEKRQWIPTDSHPGATDLNRIETGIADADAVIERIRQLPKLAKNAKAAEIVDAYNALIDAVSGVQLEAPPETPPNNAPEGNEGEGE